MNEVTRYITRLSWDDVPPATARRLDWLLRDYAAVSLLGRAVPAARLAADHADRWHPGATATALLDGRRCSPIGAAWANGVLADALDLDDGHSLVKGHPGAVIIPAALALAEHADATPDELRIAVLIGYEVGVRTGLSWHRSGTYHGSGSWGAVGAAAAGARLLGLDENHISSALGLAAFHAPLVPTMQSVADPAMTKDGTGWGAAVGVESCLLAEAGFTAAVSALFENGHTGLGETWVTDDVYVKAFPCCRWSHPAVQAALVLRSDHPADVSRIRRVLVRTFGAAAGLPDRPPRTTEQAQYSLAWPVAVALAHGTFGVEHVVGNRLDDPDALRLLERIEVTVDPDFDAAFPARRLAAVSVTIGEQTAETAVTEAPGEPSDPGWERIIEAKLARCARFRSAASAAEAELDSAQARPADCTGACRVALGSASLAAILHLLTGCHAMSREGACVTFC